MGKHRLCLNCKKQISLFQSIIFNKCCSLDCDYKYEDKLKRQEREDLEKWKQSTFGQTKRDDERIKLQNNQYKEDNEEEYMYQNEGSYDDYYDYEEEDNINVNTYETYNNNNFDNSNNFNNNDYFYNYAFMDEYKNNDNDYDYDYD